MLSLFHFYCSPYYTLFCMLYLVSKLFHFHLFFVSVLGYFYYHLFMCQQTLVHYLHHFFIYFNHFMYCYLTTCFVRFHLMLYLITIESSYQYHLFLLLCLYHLHQLFFVTQISYHQCYHYRVGINSKRKLILETCLCSLIKKFNYVLKLII